MPETAVDIKIPAQRRVDNTHHKEPSGNSHGVDTAASSATSSGKRDLAEMMRGLLDSPSPTTQISGSKSHDKNVRDVGREVALTDFTDSVGPYEVDHSLPGYEARSGVFVGVKTPDGPAMLKIHSSGEIARKQIDEEAAFLKTVSQQTDHVPRLYDHADILLSIGGGEKTVPSLLMEYVKGEKLEDAISDKGKLDMRTVISLFGTVAQALDAIHKAGYAHMDIKPSNIIWRENTTEGVLIDFDTVRKMGEKVGEKDGEKVAAIGSMGFMGPDHIKPATEIDASLDVWQLASSAYNTLTGHTIMPPSLLDPILFYAQDDYEAHIKEQLAALPDTVRDVFSRALAYNSQERYASPTAFIDSLNQAYTTGESQNQDKKNRAPGKTGVLSRLRFGRQPGTIKQAA